MLPERFSRVSLLLNLPLDLHTVSFSRTKVEFISVLLDNESETQSILYYNIYWILLQIIISSGVQSVLLLMHIKQAQSPERWNSCFCSVSSPLPWLFFILMLYFLLKYLQFSPTMCVAKKKCHWTRLASVFWFFVKWLNDCLFWVVIYSCFHRYLFRIAN